MEYPEKYTILVYVKNNRRSLLTNFLGGKFSW